MITVTTIQCPRCGDKIYSRTRHDFHYCSCGKVFVDGGFDYLRYGWDNDIQQQDIKIEKLDIDTTKKTLYDDWNYQYDKFGIIIREE